jgi:hypothetical protein
MQRSTYHVTNVHVNSDTCCVRPSSCSVTGCSSACARILCYAYPLLLLPGDFCPQPRAHGPVVSLLLKMCDLLLDQPVRLLSFRSAGRWTRLLLTADYAVSSTENLGTFTFPVLKSTVCVRVVRKLSGLYYEITHLSCDHDEKQRHLLSDQPAELNRDFRARTRNVITNGGSNIFFSLMMVVRPKHVAMYI